jgi:cytochrome P450 family 97 subfamily B polypeptide 3
MKSLTVRSNARVVHRSLVDVRRSRAAVVSKGVSAEALGWGLFFTPGLAALVYSAIRGKGNVKDGFSHLITIVSQGYLQPDAGGKDIPVATGDLSEFAGSYIGFLYKQCAHPGSRYGII